MARRSYNPGAGSRLKPFSWVQLVNFLPLPAPKRREDTMDMRLLKPLLALLLAWTFSFQAMASVGGLSCRHAAGSPPQALEAMPAGHAGMHHDHAAMQQGEHAGHVMAQAADDASGTAPAPGCDCSCDCAMIGCSGSGPGMAVGLSLSPLAPPAESLRAFPAPAATSGAYILDLIRPPSMS